jgi:hypothetical protein
MSAVAHAIRTRPREREILGDIEQSVLDLPATTGPASPRIVGALASLLGCDRFAAKRPARDEAGNWRLGDRTNSEPEFLEHAEFWTVQQ